MAQPMSDAPQQPNLDAPPAVAPNSGRVVGGFAKAAVPLLILFGSLYFVQGIVEPTAGLLAQPTQSRLQGWGRTPAEVGVFLGFIAIPWSLKPLFGLLSDLIPVRGFRRLPYLVISTAGAGIAYWLTSLTWTGPEHESQAAWLLFAACAAVAMTDVVIDALAVETGQPLRLTGQVQSVQWAALSAAQIIAGTLGGHVAQHGRLSQALVGSGALSLSSLVVVLWCVREPERPRAPSDNLRQAWLQLTSGRRLMILLAVGAFLFLWNFNPFSNNVLQHYSTKVLGLSEQFYGLLSSVQGVAQVASCIIYGFVCRRIPFGWLIHAAIAAGVLSTLCYWPMHNAATAVAASIVFGLTYQLGTLIQLDLAARVCPTQSAGTIFALLMATCNTGVSASIWVSGGWYDGLAASGGGRHVAFDAMVAIGAAFTAGCWLLAPVMKRAGVDWK
jgi:Na+/melibiose symporter-like transporter